jgi:hypothetical protein
VPPKGTLWSELVSHRLTWLTPGIVADAMPRADADIVLAATSAHVLALSEGAAIERVKGGTLTPSRELGEVLEHLRRARDKLIARVGRTPIGIQGYVPAALVTSRAMSEGRALLASPGGVPLSAYRRVTRDKWRLALPAPLVLAHAAGWTTDEKRSLETMLVTLWTAMQICDDVLRWERDLIRGGAWPAALIGEHADDPTWPPEETRGVPLRKRVHRSGVLARLLREAQRCFSVGGDRANALRLHDVALWAKNRENYIDRLAEAEDEHAGYAVRAHALAPWVAEVLA